MKKWMYIGIIALFIFMTGAVCGWNLRKKTFTCPEIVTHTQVINDTITHTIQTYVPYYITRVDSIVYHDTIEIPVNVDTAFILKDWSAKHYYTREWTDDTLLYVLQKDMVTKNQIYANEFTYKILRPQTIITNINTTSTVYNKYITLGFSFPLKDPNYFEIGSYYMGRKGHVGLGYVPELKSASVKLGINLFSFK